MKKNQVEEIKTELKKISDETAKKLQFISNLYNAYKNDEKNVRESIYNITNKTSFLINALMAEKDATKKEQLKIKYSNWIAAKKPIAQQNEEKSNILRNVIKVLNKYITNIVTCAAYQINNLIIKNVVNNYDFKQFLHLIEWNENNNNFIFYCSCYDGAIHIFIKSACYDDQLLSSCLRASIYPYYLKNEWSSTKNNFVTTFLADEIEAAKNGGAPSFRYNQNKKDFENLTTNIKAIEQLSYKAIYNNVAKLLAINAEYHKKAVELTNKYQEKHRAADLIDFNNIIFKGE